MSDQNHSLDLMSMDTSDGIDISEMPEGMALGTFSTTSTASTASCPFSSATSVMTAGCAG